MLCWASPKLIKTTCCLVPAVLAKVWHDANMRMDYVFAKTKPEPNGEPHMGLALNAGSALLNVVPHPTPTHTQAPPPPLASNSFQDATRATIGCFQEAAKKLDTTSKLPDEALEMPPRSPNPAPRKPPVAPHKPHGRLQEATRRPRAGSGSTQDTSQSPQEALTTPHHTHTHTLQSMTSA